MKAQNRQSQVSPDPNESPGALQRAVGYGGKHSRVSKADGRQSGWATEDGGQGKSAASAPCSWGFLCQSNQQLASPSAASLASAAAGARSKYTCLYSDLRASFPAANGLDA